MKRVEVATQAELDALGPDEIAVVRSGSFVARGSSHVVAWESAHVVAWESAHVEAWGSSHVEAWGSSHVVARESSYVVAWESAHVVARGSSHVVARESAHVEAWESAHVEARESSHVVAWGSSHVVARDSSHVEASKFVATHRLSTSANVTGGVIIDVQIETGRDWCDLHGVPVVDGKAVLWKAVEDDWRGGHKVPDLSYEPGLTVAAPDWNPSQRCGGGLHLSPHPRLARGYCRPTAHFLACEVDVEVMVPLGDKAKVPSCRVLYEVSIDGERLEEETTDG